MFDKYIKNVREQLNCNATEEYKSHYITYNYSNEEVNEYLNYFKKCYKDGLSGYKALLFFHDYLDDEHGLIK